FFPGAHQSGATRRDAVWERADFVAAHDLALVPIAPPVTDVDPVAHFSPRPDCALGGEDSAATAEADILGIVDAAILLGPGQTGPLLAAQGPSVGPGDSGSGLT